MFYVFNILLYVYIYIYINIDTYFVFTPYLGIIVLLVFFLCCLRKLRGKISTVCVMCSAV